MNIKKHSTNKRDDKPGHNKLSELPQDIMKGPQETCEPAGSHGYDLAWLVSP